MSKRMGLVVSCVVLLGVCSALPLGMVAVMGSAFALSGVIVAVRG